jgi:hypothetical protein
MAIIHYQVNVCFSIARIESIQHHMLPWFRNHQQMVRIPIDLLGIDSLDELQLIPYLSTNTKVKRNGVMIEG